MGRVVRVEEGLRTCSPVARRKAGQGRMVQSWLPCPPRGCWEGVSAGWESNRSARLPRWVSRLIAAKTKYNLAHQSLPHREEGRSLVGQDGPFPAPHLPGSPPLPGLDLTPTRHLWPDSLRHQWWMRSNEVQWLDPRSGCHEALPTAPVVESSCPLGMAPVG